MQKEFSSPYTFVTKILLPCIWVPAAGFIVLKYIFSTAEDQWLLLFSWICGSIFLVWFSLRLKRVRIDGDLLFITDYQTEISTPVTNIANITESFWSNPHTITLHFRTPTAFGEKVMFISQGRYLAFWATHPTVVELRNLMTLDESLS